MATIKGWHFVANDKKLGYCDGRLVEVGKTYTVSDERELELCEYGLHASKRLIDALQYAPSNIICRVELDAPIVHGDDKMVSYSRKVLAMIDGERILHEFACQCAEYALSFDRNPDPRSVAAIQAKRDWLDGKITNQELAAARSAAWDAARAAARYAAWAAAWAAAWDHLNKILTKMVTAAIKKGGE